MILSKPWLPETIGHKKSGRLCNSRFQNMLNRIGFCRLLTLFPYKMKNPVKHGANVLLIFTYARERVVFHKKKSNSLF